MTRAAAPTLVLLAALFSLRCVDTSSLRERRLAATPPPRAAEVALPSAPIDASADAVVATKDLASEATLALAIPARAQAPESPPSGWCGETAIQEGLLHLGVWAPQRLINRAGKPVHPDLYATDIPVALDGLGVRYSMYAVRERGFEPFARWTRGALAEGDPVIAGVKILPTAHPDWGLDHFVLVMGHGPKGLLVNTTWGTREWVSDTTTPGLSLKNAFYGIRLHGVRLPPRGIPARLSLVDEGAKTVTLRVACAAMPAAGVYRIERRRSAEDKPVSSGEVTAPISGATIETLLTVDAETPARCHCLPL
jgi:hypothetical protein